MNNSKIERILEGIKTNSQGDEIIEEFLTSLIFDELRNSNEQWRGKYRRKLKESLEKWERNDEN